MKLTDLKRAGHAPTLLSAFLHFDISFMVWVILGALAPYFASDSALTGGHKAAVSASVKLTLVGVPLLAAGFWRILLGILVDRIGPKKVGVVSLSMTLVPLLIGWQMPGSYGNLLLIGFFLGLAGASFAVALPLASRWYPPEMQGIALGIAGAGNSGTALAALFAPTLAKVYGWNTVIGLAALPLACAFVVYLIFARDAPDRPAPKRLVQYLEVLKTSDCWWLMFLYSVTFGGFSGLASSLTIYFAAEYGLDPVIAGFFTAACVFFGSLLRPVGGAVADRIGGVRTLMSVYALAAVCLAVASFHLAGAASALAVILMGMGALGAGNGAVFQLAPQRFRAEIGVITGLVGAMGGVGGFYLATTLGLSKQLTGAYQLGFLGFAGLAVIALVALALLKAHWRARWPKLAGAQAAAVRL